MAILYSTLRGSKVSLPFSVVEALQEGNVPEEMRQALLRLGIVVEDAAAEVEQVKSIFDTTDRVGKRFTAVVTLNLDCNLACPYCYEDVIFSPVCPSAGEAGHSDFAMGCACADAPWLVEASLYLRREILKRGYSTPKPKVGGCMAASRR